MNATVARARHGHPGLYWFAVAMAALAVVMAGLALVDQRTLLGESVWFKPLRFAISFTLYAGALAWMLARLPGRGMRRTGWVIVVTSAIEVAIITGQAAQGVRSHFAEDPIGLRLQAIMIATIVVLYLATVAVALRFLRERSDDGATATAVRLGLAVGVVGLTVGFVMAANMGHTVGVPDGGPGLPFVGWSTVGGDLRIGHFVGMHALQLLPLLAAVLARFGRDRFDEWARVQIVRVAAAGYGGLVLLVTWQALRAQPLLAPDALTLAALVTVLAGSGAALAAVLQSAARRRTAAQTVAGPAARPAT